MGISREKKFFVEIWESQFYIWNAQNTAKVFQEKRYFGEIWEESQFYILNSQKYTYVFPSAQYICTDVSQPVYIS